MSTQQIYDQVTERYSVASKGVALEYGASVAKAFGYSEDELADTPKESNLGLSCGNPLAIASIREVITCYWDFHPSLPTRIDTDLQAIPERNRHRPGQWRWLRCLPCCHQGRAERQGHRRRYEQGMRSICAPSEPSPSLGSPRWGHGTDCRQDMLSRANEIKTKHNKTNVSFVESQITDMPAIPSNTADCIISNCVINLVPENEKHLVFKEMHRVLKPGGRVAISDILAKKPLPEKLRANMALYVGCVSGASLVSQYEEYLQEAGFPAESVLIKHDGADLNVYIETNPDGTRTIGGKGGNLCCNPSIQSAPAAPATNGSSSSCSGPKSKPDAAAASAAASASCCGGENKTSQECAFDEKDLADLEGQDLNDWAGESMHFQLLPGCPFLRSRLRANIEFKGPTRYMLSNPKCWLLGRRLLALGVEFW